MRKLIISFGIFVIAVVALAVIVPMVIPATVYRDQVVTAVQGATGRQLHINGSVKLTILPNLAIEANDVALDNAPGGIAREMATLSQLQVGVKLLPLLHGSIEISRFVLSDPVIHLEVGKDGKPNWEFGTAEAAKPKSGVTVTATVQSDDLKELRLGVVKLVNGTIDYFDARTSQHFAATQIGVTVTLPGLDQPASFDGSVTWNGRPIKLSLTAERPRALMGSGSSTLNVSVASDLMNLSFDGTATGGMPAKLEGNLSVDANSVRSLATVAGSPPPIGGDGLGAFSLKGKVASVGSSLTFSDIAFTLDALKAGGSIAIDGNGTIPTVKGALSVGTLDLNPYLARPAKGPAPAMSAPQAQSPAQPAPVQPGPPAAPGQWSDAPIDLTALKSIEADVTIAASGLRYEKIEIGKSALAIALHGGRLTVALNELALYGGNGKGQLVLDGAGAVPGLMLGFALEGVQAQPLLAAAIDFDKLTGAGQLSIDVASRGRSQRELVGALSGKGAFGFANGSIKGIDLAAMMKNVGQAFLQAATDTAAQTNFAALDGTFTVSNGIVRNDDLLLRAPLLQVQGAGAIDLPHRSLDYRVEPNVTAGSRDFTVPVLIRGPWDKLSYQPDLQGALTKNAGKLLQGVLGGKSANPAKSPGSLLQGLFGK